MQREIEARQRQTPGAGLQLQKSPMDMIGGEEADP